MDSRRPIYKKRKDVTGILGVLYEIKLISLMYFRAFHDGTIKDFQIASNVHGIKDFGNICFKVQNKGLNKPVTVFIHVRHKKYGKLLFMDKLTRYFRSYLELKQQFDQSYDNDTECFFVIYTNAPTEVGTYEPRHQNIDFISTLNNLIKTGDCATQFGNAIENIERLCEVAMKEQMTYLAKRVAKFVQDDSNYPMLLMDEVVQRYHVILAREVLHVSEIQPDAHRFASFRPDFFYTHHEYLSVFKDTLFIEIANNKKIDPTNLNHLFYEFLTDPTDASKLSKLIGKGIAIKNGHLTLDISTCKAKQLESEMKQIKISQSTEYEAVKIAAREILSCCHFKVPAAFGNKDLTLRGSDAKVDRRIRHLVATIYQIIERFKPLMEITIDESLAGGFLQLNGGIAGAIGNVFVLDDDPQLMKITDNWEQLETFSKILYLRLNTVIHNLHAYKFRFKFNKCPKLSFERSWNEEKMAIDFLNRLLVYANQADVDLIEHILKKEIEEYQCDQANTFEAITDAIYSRYYCQIQNWWMLQDIANYLTRNYNLFRESTNNMIKNPLMSSINLLCKSKIKQYNYTFTEDAVGFLKFQKCATAVIITENSTLTVVKMMQQLENDPHVVLDFDYIANLPIADRVTLIRRELTQTNYGKVLILICDGIKQERLVCDKTYSRNDIECMVKIAEVVKYKRTIIVTNQMIFNILQDFFPKPDKIIHDKKLRLVDLEKESQMNIIENATATFPGVEIKLEELLRGWPLPGSR